MRKLILQMQTSVDGFVADKNGKGNWMIWNWGREWRWDPALQAYHIALMSTIDSVLLSRKMAVEGFIDHWAEVAANAADPQASFANYIAAAQKIVFTKTLNEPVWANTTLEKTDLTQAVREIKRAPGKNMIAFGGASFASALIAEDLVDEYHLLVNPAALGEGLPIFSRGGKMTSLVLQHAQPFTCGVTVMQYRRA